MAIILKNDPKSSLSISANKNLLKEHFAPPTPTPTSMPMPEDRDVKLGRLGDLLAASRTDPAVASQGLARPPQLGQDARVAPPLDAARAALAGLGVSTYPFRYSWKKSFSSCFYDFSVLRITLAAAARLAPGEDISRSAGRAGCVRRWLDGKMGRNGRVVLLSARGQAPARVSLLRLLLAILHRRDVVEFL